MRLIYLLLAIIGAFLPYALFVPWVLEHGLDIPLLVGELFSTRIGGFFGLDVVVSALVLIIFIVRDSVQNSVPMPWLPIVATCLVGVSCGLPLFLYLREGWRGGAT